MEVHTELSSFRSLWVGILSWDNLILVPKPKLQFSARAAVHVLNNWAIAFAFTLIVQTEFVAALFWVGLCMLLETNLMCLCHN